MAATVLILDDEASLLELIGDIVHAKYPDCRVKKYVTGEQVVSDMSGYLGNGEPVTLLLDVENKLGKGGLEVCTEVFQVVRPGQDIQVILMSCEQKYRADAANRGLPFLEKPFGIDTLLETIEPYMSRAA